MMILTNNLANPLRDLVEHLGQTNSSRDPNLKLGGINFGTFSDRDNNS